MFPSRQHHQEIVRQRHAHLLREARRERLASMLTAEREGSPFARLGRLIEGRLLGSLRRRGAHASRPGCRAV
jgi:hypothetical protein